MLRNTKIASDTNSAGRPDEHLEQAGDQPDDEHVERPTPMKARIVPNEPVYVPKPRPPIR